MKRLLLAVPALAVAACSTPLTPQRLAPSFAEVFTGLYVAQQLQLGRDSLVPESLHVLTSCRRTGDDRTGPGEDWVCGVQYVDLATSSSQAFEVQVKPDGCWKAEGNPAVQPATLVDPVTLRTAANPLAEFDGCLDTSW